MKKEDLKHGMRVTCEINGRKIEDAKISIDSDGDIYICQNVVDVDSATAEDELGYEYSYYVDEDEIEDDEYKIRPVETPATTLPTTKPKDIADISTYEVGDVLVNPFCNDRIVLGICGKVFFLGEKLNYGIGSIEPWTTDQAVYFGMKFKDQPEEEVEELTLDEVCKELGRKIKIVE